jgi:hypothetical protein
MWSIPAPCDHVCAQLDRSRPRRGPDPKHERAHPGRLPTHQDELLVTTIPLRRPRIPWSARCGATESGRISTSDTTQDRLSQHIAYGRCRGHELAWRDDQSEAEAYAVWPSARLHSGVGCDHDSVRCIVQRLMAHRRSRSVSTGADSCRE